MTTAARQWHDDLAAWAIPPEILAKAPESPWGFPVELFKVEADGSGDSPSRRHALEALPVGGSVLDVGCGGGAASLALVPPASHVTGVDSSEQMLEEYAAAAARLGVAHEEIHGAWPDVADRAGEHDVVVCHHVFYNVADLAPFVRALDAAARRRVVVELTGRHPLASTSELWRHFHGIERPARPTAGTAVDVLRDLGITPQQERWSRPPRNVPRQVYVSLNRRRLCLPLDAEAEVDRVMGEVDMMRDVVTLWWDHS